LIEGKQVVVPVAVRISPQKWGTTSWANNSYVGALAVAWVNDKEVVALASMLAITCSRGHFQPAFGFPTFAHEGSEDVVS
jgi:hypothetical protein